MIKRLIKWYKTPKYSEWFILGTYSHVYDEYCTLFRKNMRTGMLQFKTLLISKKSNLKLQYTNDIQQSWIKMEFLK
jgi:hypothetical protein